MSRRAKLSARMRDVLVHDIADRSLSQARERLWADLSAMSTAELRGYVRARADAPVRHWAGQVAADRGLTRGVANELLQRALQRTTLVVVRQLSARPPAADYHVPLRIAG